MMAHKSKVPNKSIINDNIIKSQRIKLKSLIEEYEVS